MDGVLAPCVGRESAVWGLIRSKGPLHGMTMGKTTKMIFPTERGK